MAKNDILLLDQVVWDAARAASVENSGDFFQRFAFEQILKDRDLSPDELEAGIVDGRVGGLGRHYNGRHRQTYHPRFTSEGMAAVLHPRLG